MAYESPESDLRSAVDWACDADPGNNPHWPTTGPKSASPERGFAQDDITLPNESEHFLAVMYGLQRLSAFNNPFHSLSIEAGPIRPETPDSAASG